MFLWDGEKVATAGDKTRGSLAGSPALLPGFSSLIARSNFNLGVVNAKGDIIDGVSDTALSAGQLVYYRGGTARWALADADAVSTTDFVLGIVLNTVGATGNDITVLLDGIYTSTFVDGVTTIGDALYVGQTAGNVSATVPTAAASIIRGVGFVLGNNGTFWSVNFRPDVTYFTNG